MPQVPLQNRISRQIILVHCHLGCNNTSATSLGRVDKDYGLFYHVKIALLIGVSIFAVLWLSLLARYIVGWSRKWRRKKFERVQRERVRSVKRPAAIIAAARAWKTPKDCIFIKTLTGKTFSIIIGPFDTIRDLKYKIQAREGIPSCQQRLVFDGKALDGWYDLCDYYIFPGSTIHLVLILRGGGPGLNQSWTRRIDRFVDPRVLWRPSSLERNLSRIMEEGDQDMEIRGWEAQELEQHDNRWSCNTMDQIHTLYQAEAGTISLTLVLQILS